MFAVATALHSAPAQGGITSVGGSVTIQSTPTTGTIAENSIESANVSVWFESTGTLGSNVNVQHDGTAGTYSKYSQLVSGTLFAGAFYESYMVQFDPVGSPGQEVTIGQGGNVTITFDHEIIGLYAQSTGSGGNLNATDATFAPTTYNFANSRSFENNKDIFTISTDRMTLTIDLSGVKGATVDQLRVLINPEPSTAWTFGVGFVLFGYFSARRRRAARSRAASASDRPAA